MMRMWIWIAFVFSLQARAKTFQNSYIRLELPDSWTCNQENVSYVCSPLNPSDAREALIVVTAKVAGPEDTANAFYNYLRMPKTLITKSKTTLSQPLKIGRFKTAGIDWVQAIHFGSEVPGFTTRYLAGVQGKLALLLSLSADEASLSKYSPIFDRAVNSIQVNASNQVIMQALQNRNISPDKVIGGGEMARNQGAYAQGSLSPAAIKRRKVYFELGLIAVGVLLGLALIRKFV